MADLDLSMEASGVAACSANQLTVTLNPRRIYELTNHGTVTVYGSTDGVDVDADANQKSGKLIMESVSVAFTIPSKQAFCSTLKLRTASGTASVSIRAVGLVSP